MPHTKLILPIDDEVEDTFQGDDEESCQRLLTNTSNLLAAVGISTKRISSIKELHRAASSMFVAVFETIFRIRLKGVTRNPRTKIAYAQNAQIIIDGLSEQIQMDLHHIRGKAILDGDMTALSNLVNIFMRIISVINRESLSDEGVYSDDQLSSTSSGSLSTHESTFDYNSHRVENSEKKEEIKNKTLNREDIIGSIALEKDIRLLSHTQDGDVFRFLHKLQEINGKLDKAAKRRDFIQRTRRANFKSGNIRVSEVCHTVKIDRISNQREEYRQSLSLRKTNEEHLLLRKAYEGFARKLKEWKAEEARDARDRSESLRDREKIQLKSVAQLFHDHIKNLQQKEVINFDDNQDNSLIVINQKRLRSEISKYHRLFAKGLYSVSMCTSKEKIDSSKTSITTTNDKESNVKYSIKSNHYLFSVLSHTNWESSLRDSGMFIEDSREEWR